jgi:hypothetical protein
MVELVVDILACGKKTVLPLLLTARKLLIAQNR